MSARCVTPEPEADVTAAAPKRSRRKSPKAPVKAPAASLEPADRFLTALAQTGNFSAACRASTITRREVNHLRQANAEFELAFHEAMDEAADLLEAEAWRRALEGVAEPVMKGGKPVLDSSTGEAIMVLRRSDALLVMLLRGSKPGKFALRPTLSAREDPAQIIREMASDRDPPRRDAKPEWRRP